MCGKVTEVKSPEIIMAVDNMRLKRFRKDGFTLYVYGVCSSCQTKISRRKKMSKSKVQEKGKSDTKRKSKTEQINDYEQGKS
jgi:Fur family ferric uptake transcriptional regulator